MSEYLVVTVATILLFALVLLSLIIVAVIKGFRAGETTVEIRLLGIIQFSIRLSDISAKKHNKKPSSQNIRDAE